MDKSVVEIIEAVEVFKAIIILIPGAVIIAVKTIVRVAVKIISCIPSRRIATLACSTYAALCSTVGVLDVAALGLRVTTLCVPGITRRCITS
jgi:hypothetical protein